jgi:hypothetical protein
MVYKREDAMHWVSRGFCYAMHTPVLLSLCVQG